MPRNSLHAATCPFCYSITRVVGFDAPGPSITSCPHFLALLSQHRVRFGEEVEAEEVMCGDGDVTGSAELNETGVPTE